MTIPVRLRTNTGLRLWCPGPGGWSGPGHRGHQPGGHRPHQPPGPQGVRHREKWAHVEWKKKTLCYIMTHVSKACLPSCIRSLGLHRPAAQSSNNLRQEHPALPGPGPGPRRQFSDSLASGASQDCDVMHCICECRRKIFQKVDNPIMSCEFCAKY